MAKKADEMHFGYTVSTVKRSFLLESCFSPLSLRHFPSSRKRIIQGRALFDQSVLKSPNRSVPVGLGLEILVQSLVQDDFDYCGTEKVKPNSVFFSIAAIP